MFVDGKWLESSSQETFRLLDPATGEAIGEVPRGTREDARGAVEAARRAFANPEWRWMDATRRGRILLQIAGLIREKETFNELARLESLNVGKPLRESKGDVAWAARAFEYFGGLADKIQGETIPTPGLRLDYTIREPLGVTVHIVPWNYPLSLAARSIAPALAAGNTVIVKPSELTPLSTLKLAELVHKSGLPNGAFNIVTGSGAVAGVELVSNPEVDGIAFTGSIETGVEVMERAAKNITRVLLELGGKNPNIVFPDADFEKAVQSAKEAIFTNAGQMCWAGSRLILHEDIHEKFMAELKKTTEAMKLGPGLDEKTDMGPLISREQQTRVLGYIRSGIEEGARLVTGGGVPEDPSLQRGNYVKPTIFYGVNSDMKIGREEIFGPVLSVFTFRTVDEVVELSNATRYGLYVGVWTNNLKLAHQVAARLESGVVAINEYLVTFPQTPFGGYKDSGLGYENGLQAIGQYTRIKNVSVNLS